jgi:hypothetical protein
MAWLGGVWIWVVLWAVWFAEERFFLETQSDVCYKYLMERWVGNSSDITSRDRQHPCRSGSVHVIELSSGVCRAVQVAS